MEMVGATMRHVLKRRGWAPFSFLLILMLGGYEDWRSVLDHEVEGHFPGMVERKMEVTWVSDTQRNCVLVPCGCHNKSPLTEWLNTTEMYTFTVLEAGSLAFHEVLSGQAAPSLLHLHCLEYVACKVAGVEEERDAGGTDPFFEMFLYFILLLCKISRVSKSNLQSELYSNKSSL